MSLFNGYQKQGPGVDKSQAYEPNRFNLYFQLLGRKFWNIGQLSLIFTLFSLPYLAAAYGMFCLTGTSSVLTANLHLRLLLILLPFSVFGPVLTAGYKVARDFAREEPTFIFSDFWDAFKSNVGTSALLSFFSYFFMAALSYALPAYFLSGGIMTYVCFPLCLLASLALYFTQFYLYTMAGVFELSFKDIWKNGLILSFLCIGRNLILFLIFGLLTALGIVCVFLSFSYPIVFGFLILLLVSFIPAFGLFTTSFVIHPALQKYIVEPYYRANPEQTSAVLQKKPVSDEELDDAPKKELPEYIYHNGRMVHRSVLEKESLFEDMGRTDNSGK